MMPVDKFDTAAAAAIVAAGDASHPALLEWGQDLNWPVARVLAPLLASAGSVIVPGVRRVLSSGDECWKASVLSGVVAESPELLRLLRLELERLVRMPTQGERDDGVVVVTLDILALQ